MRLLLLTLWVALSTSAAVAQERLSVVASLSIIGDLVRQVGGERVDVAVLVGPGGDAHVYQPTPADARRVAAARLVFVNGLGLEGWLPRLAKSAGAPRVATLTQGVKPIREEDGHGHGHDIDPHAWQNVANVKIYVENIRKALAEADAAGAEAYAERARAYAGALDQLDAEIRDGLATIPPARRRVITTHDAFGYYSKAYGIAFVAPQGVSTETEASARDVARIIRQIKAERIPAVFLENMSDPRLMQQIARESGARIGAPLFSDSLSDSDGPAPTYLAMMRNNLRALTEALR